jgi:hypothetical protein
MQGGQNETKMEARGGLTEESITVACILYMCTYLSHVRYLRITVPCV